MKKLVSTLVILSVIVGLTMSLPANAEEQQPGEDHIFSSRIDPDAEFTDDCIIVVLKHDYGVINVEVKPDFFPEISDNIEEIEDLFYIENPEDILSNYEYLDRYRQILCVHLIEHGREKVLEAIVSLDGRKDIEDVSPNYIVKTEPCVTPTSDYYNYSDTKAAYDKIQLPAAWNIVYNKLGSVGSSNVNTAVMDTQVMHHPDLSSNLVTGYDAHNNNTITDDIPHTEGYNSHGTSVASLIGAEANSDDIPGTNWDVSIVPIQYTNSSGSMDVTDFAKAFNYLNNNGVLITNLSSSFQLNDTQVAVYKRIVNNYMGILIVCAGNDGHNIDSSAYSSYPSNFDCPNIISVGNTTNNDAIYSDNQGGGSNFGATSVDLFAPGKDITSLCAWWHNGSLNYGLCNSSGTSLSTPLVTGVASLIKAYNQDLSPLYIKKLILDNVDTVSGLSGKCVTGGRLNAYKALYAASQVQTTDSYRFAGKVSNSGYDDIIEVRRIGGPGGKYEILTYFSEESGILTNYTPISGSTIKYYRTVTWFDYDPTYEVVVLSGYYNNDSFLDIAFLYARKNSGGKRSIMVHYGATLGTTPSVAFPADDYGYFEYCNVTNTDNSQNLSLYPSQFFVGKTDTLYGDDIIVMYKDQDDKRAILAYPSNGYYGFSNSGTHKTTTDRLYVSSDPVFLGDVNGDGLDDLIVHWTKNGYRTLTSILATGSCVYESHGHDSDSTNSTDPVYKSQYRVADVNNDGKDDFVVLYKSGSSTFKQLVYQGTTSGSQPLNPVPVTSNPGTSYHAPLSLNVGHVNNDGYADLICEYANSNLKRCFVVFYGSSTSTFTSGTYTSVNSADATLFDSDVLVGQFSNGNYTDVIVFWTPKTYTPQKLNYIHYESRKTSITNSSTTPYYTVQTGLFNIPFYSYY